MKRRMQTWALVAAGSLGGAGLWLASARAATQEDQSQPSEEAAQKAQQEADQAKEQATKAQQEAQEAQDKANQEAQEAQKGMKNGDQNGHDKAAGAGAKPGKSSAKSSGMTATGTVESVDVQGRKLTLSNEEGRTMTVRVPSGVTGLEDLKPGDRVSVQVEPTATSIQPAP